MENIESKKEMILDAALQCFARYGPYKATMDDIAATIGMKKASLYYYYKNKEAIFSDALEREALRFFESIKIKIADQKNASDKLYTMVRETMRYMKNRVEMLEFDIKAPFADHSLFHNIHMGLRKKNIDFISAIIQEGINSGEFAELNVRKTADAIRIMMDANRQKHFYALTTLNLAKINFKKLENDSLFILELIINGIKTREKTI